MIKENNMSCNKKKAAKRKKKNGRGKIEK